MCTSKYYHIRFRFWFKSNIGYHHYRRHHHHHLNITKRIQYHKHRIRFLWIHALKVTVAFCAQYNTSTWNNMKKTWPTSVCKIIISFYFRDKNVSSSLTQIKVVASCGLSMYKTSSKSKSIFILKGLIGVRSIKTSQVVINVSNLAFKMLSNNIGCMN